MPPKNQAMIVWTLWTLKNKHHVLKKLRNPGQSPAILNTSLYPESFPKSPLQKRVGGTERVTFIF